jgi:hypothetical protein
VEAEGKQHHRMGSDAKLRRKRMFFQFFDFKNKNKVSLIFGLAAAVCAVIALILYVTTGVTNFTANKLDGWVIGWLLVGVILSLISAVFDFKLLKYFTFISLLVAFLQFILFEIDYIANIFTSIDPTAITLPFVATMVFCIVNVISSLISAIACSDKIEALAAKEGK